MSLANLLPSRILAAFVAAINDIGIPDRALMRCPMKRLQNQWMMLAVAFALYR